MNVWKHVLVMILAAVITLLVTQGLIHIGYMKALQDERLIDFTGWCAMVDDHANIVVTTGDGQTWVYPMTEEDYDRWLDNVGMY